MKSKNIDLRIAEIGKNPRYPRKEVNQTTVERYAQAMRSGSVFPPITVAVLSGSHSHEEYTLVDGLHRIMATDSKEEFISAEVIKLKNANEVYVEAVRRNAEHGRPFTPDERDMIARTLKRDMKLGLEEISKIINTPVDELEFIKNVEKVLSEPERLLKEISTPVRSAENESPIYGNHIFYLFSSLIRHCKKIRELLDEYGIDSRFTTKRIARSDVIIALKDTRAKIDSVLQKNMKDDDR